MKALIVIDVPDGFETETAIAIVDVKNEKGEGGVGLCYPKPLPQKKVGDDLYERYGSWTLNDEKEASYRLGFNDCLDEILGETE